MLKTRSITNIFDQPLSSDKKLIYETNFLGQKLRKNTNIPKLMIYDDGSVEKKITLQ